MSWTCAACATANGEADPRCVVCHAARPPAGGAPTLPTVPVVTASPSPAPAAPARPAANAPVPPAFVPPAASAPPVAAAAPAGSGRNPWMAVAIIAVLALFGIGIGLVLAGGGGGGDDAAPSGDPTDIDGGTGGSPDATGTDDGALDGTTAAPTTTAPTTMAAPTTTVPEADLLPYDRWVTILYSRSKAEYRLDQVRAEADALASGHSDSRVRVIDSDAWPPHWTPGYWAIILVDFGSRPEALAGCSEYGIPVGDCYPRQTATGER